jgi:hypothetical protein
LHLKEELFSSFFMNRERNMKINRFWILLIFVIIFVSRSQAQKYYEVSTIDSAQVRVFAVDKPEQADLLVFFVYEAKDVTKIGYWMQVSNKK